MDNKGDSVNIVLMKIVRYETGALADGGRRFDFFDSASAAAGSGEAGKGYAGLFSRDIYELPVTDGKEIIWGHRIVDAALEAGVNELLCRDIAGEGYTPGEKLETALVLENRKGLYSWNEKEKIYNFAEKYLGGSCGEAVCALVQESGSFLASVTAFASLPPLMKKLAGRGIVDLKTAASCSDIPDKALSLLENAIMELSFSRRRIFLVNISEIIKKNSFSQEQSFKLAESIASDEEPFSAVSMMRYPELDGAIKAFESFSADLLKNSGVRLKHPPNFEGEYFSAEFSFRSKKQLDKVINTFEQLRDRCDELFRLL